MEISNDNFIQFFNFIDDTSKPGRVLSSVKIGDVYMSRLIIEPGVTTGNIYHQTTRVMYFLSKGILLAAFEDVKSKQRQECVLRAGNKVVHLLENVAMATKNIGCESAELITFSNNPLRSEDTVPYHLL